MATALVPSHSLIIRCPPASLLFPSSWNHRYHLLGNISKHGVVSLSKPLSYPSLRCSRRLPIVSVVTSRSLRNSKRSTVSPFASSLTAAASVFEFQEGSVPADPLLTGSTRIITTLAALVLAVAKAFADKIFSFGLQPHVQQSLIRSVGPAFFASVKHESAGHLNTIPFTAVAAGLAKWLDIFTNALTVRCLLSWFPNVPWERQPFSALRDLCDPLLILFSYVIPPIFGNLDISSLLAFVVLGALGSFLDCRRAGF